jgi:hypothetical protein
MNVFFFFYAGGDNLDQNENIRCSCIQNNTFIFIPRVSFSVLIPKLITHTSEPYTEISVQLLKIRKKTHVSI